MQNFDFDPEKIIWRNIATSIGITCTASAASFAAFLNVYNTFQNKESSNSEIAESIANFIGTTPVAVVAAKDAMTIIHKELNHIPQYNRTCGTIIDTLHKIYSKFSGKLAEGEVSM